MAPQIYALFDTFDSAADRETHLAGTLAAALMEKASELLSRAPIIEKIEILASHESAVVLQPVQAHASMSLEAHPAGAALQETPKVGSTDAPGG